MTHVTPADADLAKRVQEQTKRRCADWQIARLREGGLITWDRPGNRGRPGRAAGRYRKGTERQAAEALDLIRHKVDKDVVVAVLFLRDRTVSLSALRRFGGRAIGLMARAFGEVDQRLPALLDAVYPQHGERPSQKETAVMVRQVLGTRGREVMEWASAVISGDQGAVQAPHPGAGALFGLDDSVVQIDYDSLEYQDPEIAPELVERVQNWADAGGRLLTSERREVVLRRMGDISEWEAARGIIQALIVRERSRRGAAEYLPAAAEALQDRTTQILNYGPQRRKSDEERAWMMFPFLFLTEEELSENTLNEGVSYQRASADVANALATLGRDCPRRWRPALDRLITQDDDCNEDLNAWFIRWIARKPEVATVLRGETTTA
jgi:hypothetical protein